MPITGATLSNTVNYSGMLYSRRDQTTRFLDAIYARGRSRIEGAIAGSVTNFSTQFILASGYDLRDPAQPSISEQQSMQAPTPTTVERDQETNVNQIFIEAAEVSFVAQSNRDALGGVNLANQGNNRQNLLDFQVGTRIAQVRLDLNWTLLNGDYQFQLGSTSVPAMTRGVLKAIETNRFDLEDAELTDTLMNNFIAESIQNGADPTAYEIWVHPEMLPKLTHMYALIPGTNQPATRTEGGIAYNQILTHYAPIDVHWDRNIPKGKIALINMSQMAVSEKPYFDIDGNLLGTLFYIDKPKPGASEGGMIYGEFGCDYAAEWHHMLIENIA